MNSDFWFAAACFMAFMSLVGGLVGGCLYEDYLIAKSPDPIATACALDKKQACVLLAARK